MEMPCFSISLKHSTFRFRGRIRVATTRYPSCNTSKASPTTHYREGIEGSRKILREHLSVVPELGKATRWLTILYTRVDQNTFSP